VAAKPRTLRATGRSIFTKPACSSTCLSRRGEQRARETGGGNIALLHRLIFDDSYNLGPHAVQFFHNLQSSMHKCSLCVCSRAA
jgi:hypothetical protein